jgi:hypothetical protein
VLHTQSQSVVVPQIAGKFGQKVEIDPSTLSSVTLARLAEEVKNHGPMVYGAFDRVFNRHNR